MFLAETYNADKEIVELGALLHDIALMTKTGTRGDHHINGKLIAEQLLSQIDYPYDKKERVLNCIEGRYMLTLVPRMRKLGEWQIPK